MKQEGGEAVRTVLVIGEGEPLVEGVCQALRDRYETSVESAKTHGARPAAIATAPDLIVLVGIAAVDGGASVLKSLSQSQLSAVIPAVLLTERCDLDERFRAMRYGAAGVVARSSSVDAIAKRIAELCDEIPEREGKVFGELGETTLDEFISVLARELRTGILSIRGGSAEQQMMRLVLGEGRDVQELIQEFVRRVGPLIRGADIVQYEFQEHTERSLRMFNTRSTSPPPPEASIAGLRVLIADNDSMRADMVAQELRNRGAVVIVSDLEGRRLGLVHGFDPSIVVIDEGDLRGGGFQVVRAMREDPRLRWGFLLMVRWNEIWSEGSLSPDIDKLITALWQQGESETTLLERIRSRDAFDARLEVLGPARLLRVAATSKHPLRLLIQSPRASATIDVSEGLIVGAECRLRDPGGTTHYGPSALAALLALTTARIRIQPVDQAARANVMSTPDVAFAMAEAEAPPLGTAKLVTYGLQQPQGHSIMHVAAARTLPPAPSNVKSGSASPAYVPSPPRILKKPRIPSPIATRASADGKQPPPRRGARADSATAIAKVVPPLPSPKAVPEIGASPPVPQPMALDARFANPPVPPTIQVLQPPASFSLGSPAASTPRAPEAPSTETDQETVEKGSSTPGVDEETERISIVVESSPASSSTPPSLGTTRSRRSWPKGLAAAVAMLGIVAAVGAVQFRTASHQKGTGSRTMPKTSRDMTQVRSSAPNPPSREPLITGVPDEAHATRTDAPRAAPTATPAQTTPLVSKDESATTNDGGISEHGEETTNEYPAEDDARLIDARLITEKDIPSWIRILPKAERQRRIRALTVLAAKLSQAGRFDRAAIWWKRALFFDPQNSRLSARLGQALAATDRLAEGAAWLRRAIELEPREVLFRFLLANALMDAGHFDEAIAVLNEAQTMAPKSRQVRWHLRLAERRKEQALLPPTTRK